MSTRVTPPGPSCSMSREQRRRLFFGFFGSQAPQSPPRRGTPPDEPQPRMVEAACSPSGGAVPGGGLGEKAVEVRLGRGGEGAVVEAEELCADLRCMDDIGRLVAPAPWGGGAR